MKQLTLATVGFERCAKTTRRAAFLDEMDRVVPWSARYALIEPFIPSQAMAAHRSRWSGCCGSIFCSTGSICRIRQWKRHFTIRRRCGVVAIDPGREPVPDETAVCRFRHLLEERNLGRRLFDELQQHLAAKGLKVATGTIVDATIINAPSSTKNANKARDPEMPQTRNGDQWYFGMKAHFGAIMAGTADATAGGWSVPDWGGPIICGAVQHWLAGGSHQLTGRDRSWLTRRVAAELSANRLLLATKARRILLQELALRPP